MEGQVQELSPPPPSSPLLNAAGSFFAALPTTATALTSLELDTCPLISDAALRGAEIGGPPLQLSTAATPSAASSGAAAAAAPRSGATGQGGLLALLRGGRLSRLALRRLPLLTDALLAEALAGAPLHTAAAAGAAKGAAAAPPVPACALTSFVVDACPQVGPFFPPLIGSHLAADPVFPPLITISPTQVSDASVAALAASACCAGLDKLGLQHLPRVTDAGLAQVRRGSKSVCLAKRGSDADVTVPRNPVFPPLLPLQLAGVLGSEGRLRHLSLAGCAALSSAAIVATLAGLPQAGGGGADSGAASSSGYAPAVGTAARYGAPWGAAAGSGGSLEDVDFAGVTVREVSLLLPRLCTILWLLLHPVAEAL